MRSSASSYGYEVAYGEAGEKLCMVGDEYVSEQEAREYAQWEADEAYAAGGADAYDGYPEAIAPVRPGES